MMVWAKHITAVTSRTSRTTTELPRELRSRWRAFHAEAAHEALADHDRIALGRADAGLLVDTRRNQRGAASERTRDDVFKNGFVGSPGGIGNTGAARNRDEIRAVLRRGRLAAGDLADAVVHHHDRQVWRLEH